MRAAVASGVPGLDRSRSCGNGRVGPRRHRTVIDRSWRRHPAVARSSSGADARRLSATGGHGMHRGRRLISLAGTIAAIATSPLRGHGRSRRIADGRPRLRQQQHRRPEHDRRLRSPRRRFADARSPGSPFDAGGAGTGAPFGSAGGLQETADGRYLLATDPASNEISVLRIKPNGGAAARRGRGLERDDARRASPSTAASCTSPTAAPAAATTPASGSTPAAT